MARMVLSDTTSKQSTRSRSAHHEVRVHVDASALDGAGGGSDLPMPTVRRLTCDGALVAVVDGPDGRPLNVGRRQRTVTTAIKRALDARDRGCVFPGCHHERFLDAHHVEHWADGGETGLDNLMLLCASHHRLVHEGGFTIERHTNGTRYFARPDGRPVESALPSTAPVEGKAEWNDLVVEETSGVYQVGTFRGKRAASSPASACRIRPRHASSSTVTLDDLS
jgi:hypothetical protein